MSPSPTRSRRAKALAVSALAASLVGACGAGEREVAAEPAATAASADGVQQAKDAMAGWAQEPEWPDVTPIAKPADLTGKTFTSSRSATRFRSSTVWPWASRRPWPRSARPGKICDGKFNPTAVADCLKSAGDQGATPSSSLSSTTQMAGTAFDALADKGVKVLVGGVAPSGGRESDDTLAFYDNTGGSTRSTRPCRSRPVANGGADAQMLWLKLMDSTTTRSASDKGIAKAEELCPTCGVATAEFTTANLDKLPSAVSAALVSHPDTNLLIVPVDSFVPPALQGVQSAGFGDKVKVISSSSDLAGLQRIKDGQQVSDLGTPVIYEGWKYANGLMQLMAGDEVAPVRAGGHGHPRLQRRQRQRARPVDGRLLHPRLVR